MNNKQIGYFGEYGGSYVSKEVQEELDKVNDAYEFLKTNKEFNDELNYLRLHYQGRPTPLYYCEKLTKLYGGAKIFLKREDINHTGAHKINHCLGEALLAKYLKKNKIIAETGAGQHGLAIATACALMGLECEVHMGVVDIAKQKINVEKMKLLGATIVPVTDGDGTLKDATNSALASYSKQLTNSIYCIGSVVGPHPFPSMIRDFQSIIGKEVRQQFAEINNNTKPNYLIACVGGGSNAMGLFNEFIDDEDVRLIGVEALGKSNKIGENSATMKYGKTMIYQGYKSKVLVKDNGEVSDAYSIASGLDYPGVGPQHAFLNDIKRAEYVAVDDKETLNAFLTLTKVEGIIPALESSHAVAYALKLAPTLSKDQTIVVNLSGRGDKDVEFVLDYLNK